MVLTDKPKVGGSSCLIKFYIGGSHDNDYCPLIFTLNYAMLYIN